MTLDAEKRQLDQRQRRIFCVVPHFRIGREKIVFGTRALGQVREKAFRVERERKNLLLRLDEKRDGQSRRNFPLD